MKLTVFLIYVIIAVTTTTCLGQDRSDMTINPETVDMKINREIVEFFKMNPEIVEFLKYEITGRLNLTQTDLNTCLENTHIKIDDIVDYELRINNITSNNIPSNPNLHLNVGCFFACLGQKRGIMLGSQINLDEFKRWGRQYILEAELTTEKQEKVNELINNCGDLVKSKVEECKVAFEFMTCVLKGVREV